MTASASVATDNNRVREYLTFRLGDEHYAIDILTVKEIRGYESVTRIANAPEHVKGIINLRGEIVPIVDLRLCFGVGNSGYNEFTIVIVLHIHQRIVGIVVDSVSDVITLDQAELKPPPDFGVAFDHRYLIGLAAVHDDMIIVVDIGKMISSDELGLVDAQ